MPIYEQNIVFVESQVMDDVPEGGGGATGRQVIDGQMNNVFPDVSDLDRTYGRFRLRKLFVAVRSLSTDLYSGAKVAITALPTDPAIGYALFSNKDSFDTRLSAADRVSSYLFAASEWGGYLFENHVAGQRTIQLFQRPGATLPTIGRTLMLVLNEGQGNEISQYVRIIAVSSEIRTFSYSGSTGVTDYDAAIVTLDLSDALRADFPGSPPSRHFMRTAARTLIRDTRVTDAAQYYGASALRDPAAMGDNLIRVDSIYTRIVPSSQTERPIIDQSYGIGYTTVLAEAPRHVEVFGATMSMRIKITQETRGFNYTTILKPLPARDSLYVVYRAMHNTYILYDNGDGTLAGDGGGTINYVNGSVLVTLDAMPDADSAIVLYWGPNQAYTNRSGQASFTPPRMRFSLDHQDIDKGSLTIAWSSGGETKTVTDNGFGVLTGDGSGVIIYSTGEVVLQPTAMPDGGSEYAIDYTWSEMVREAKPGLSPDAAGIVYFELTQPPVPGSVEITWAVSRESSVSSGSSSTATATAISAAQSSAAALDDAQLIKITETE